MTTLVFNGWAAGPETWAKCTFPRDRIFDYLEQLDGEPERVMATIDEVLMVGFSMGGSTALRMLLRYPAKIKGLVLVSATPCMMERPDEGWKGMSAHRRAALKLGTQITYRGNSSPLFEDANLERGLEYLRHTDIREELREFGRANDGGRFPVAILQAERDGIVRPQNALFLKAVFPQAKVTLVPSNEHTLPLLVPELIDRAVFDISR